MEQFLSLKQLDKIPDYAEILKEAEKLKGEISQTKKFLAKFGLNANFEKILAGVLKLGHTPITDREKALLNYLQLKVVLIDFLLIVNDNQLTGIHKVYSTNPTLLDHMIQGTRITHKTRREIIQNMNLSIHFKGCIVNRPAGFSSLNSMNN